MNTSLELSDGKKLPQLPLCALVENVMPFLDDRITWNNLAVSCKYIHEATSKHSSPWPQCLKPPKTFSKMLGPVAVTDQHLACGSIGQIDLWDNKKGHISTYSKGLEGPLQSICFSPDGSKIAVCSAQSNPRVWLILNDDNSGDLEIPLLEAGGSLATSVSFIDDFKVNCISNDGSIWECDLLNKRCIQRYSLGVSRWYSEMLTLHDGWVATSIFQTGVVKLLNLKALGNDQVIRHNADCVNDICFDPNASFVVTAGDHGIVQIWDTKTGELVHRLYGLESNVSSVATNGYYIAASDVNGYIFVWDKSTGERVSSLDGHEKAVNTILFTNDGRYLISSGNDGIIRVWSTTEWIADTLSH